MTKEEKNKLKKRWWLFCDSIEEKIESVSSFGDGILFILLLPVWFLLKMLQWLIYLLGNWAITLIPSKG